MFAGGGWREEASATPTRGQDPSKTEKAKERAEKGTEDVTALEMFEQKLSVGEQPLLAVLRATLAPTWTMR